MVADLQAAVATANARALVAEGRVRALELNVEKLEREVKWEREEGRKRELEAVETGRKRELEAVETGRKRGVAEWKGEWKAERKKGEVAAKFERERGDRERVRTDEAKAVAAAAVAAMERAKVGPVYSFAKREGNRSASG